MPDEHGNETREEAEERIRIVRATQIFGDTPTDPTIGDVVVPTHDEEGAGANLAAANANADDEGVEGEDRLSDAEVKRQAETPQFDAAAEDLAAREEADASDDADLTAAEKVERIESTDSADEVDRLAEGDDRVTVQRAADKKREELSE